MIVNFISKPVVFVTILPFVMIVLILGTLAQNDMGIFLAHRNFFASFFVWVGFIPIPGFYLTLPIIALSLFARMFKKQVWTMAKISTNIIHFGALLLLIGALITAFSSRESFIILKHSQTSDVTSDYHEREIVITRNDVVIFKIAKNKLTENTQIKSEKLPFVINVEKIYDNSAVENGALIEKELKSDDEENQFGVIMKIQQNDSGEKIFALESSKYQPNVTIDGRKYYIILRKKQQKLPFQITLNEFRKENYPGTNKAKDYSSNVTISDGSLKWQTIISMNEPVRHSGYSIYQSSFIESEDETYTVLAIVKNSGQIFPYIASLIMLLGLLIHFKKRYLKS